MLTALLNIRNVMRGLYGLGLTLDVNRHDNRVGVITSWGSKQVIECLGY